MSISRWLGRQYSKSFKLGFSVVENFQRYELGLGRGTRDQTVNFHVVIEN